ncbi:MAG: transcription termination/antitermination NusG family protein [Pseudomonadota bacterium]
MNIKELEAEARKYYRGKLVLVEEFHQHPILVDQADPDLQWFVFQVKPKSEKVVETQVRSLGFAAIVPKITRATRAHKRCRRKVIKRVPAFSGYIFVGFPPGPVPFRKVLDMVQVRGVVAPGGRPSQLNGPRFSEWVEDKRFDAETVNDLMKGRKPYNQIVPIQDRAA